MKRLFLFRIRPGRWMGQSPSLPGQYFLGSSQEEVLERLRAQMRTFHEKENESELLIVGF